MRPLEEYADRYANARLSRDDAGVLTIRLHSDGESLVWGDGPHTELGYLFADVGADPGNRAVVLTGTGAAFCERLDDSWVGSMTPERWQKIFFHGHRLLLNLLDIEVPVIGVVNGPARIHPEIPLLSDIVIGTPTATIQDAPHFRFGTVPSDGSHIVWPELLGVNRGRSFLLMSDRIEPEEALRLGLYRSVEADTDAALAAAHTIAREIAAKPPAVVRYTRFALTRVLRERLASGLAYGLAIEGLGAYESWPEGEK